MQMWMIVALLGVVVLLYASMLPKSAERKPAADDFLDSVGDTLQQFADEIEQENQELIRMVGEMKREHERRTSTLMARIELLERHAASPAPTAPAEVPATQPAPSAASPAPSPPSPSEPANPSGEASSAPSRFAASVKERYRELFDLYDHGKSIEYIAKKLGKNKGEVQLILGLAKQEEPYRGQT